MATIITEYLLTIIDENSMTGEILDDTSYYGYQIYVDNSLLTESLTITFRFAATQNQKIDIIGISSGESGIDHSSLLSDANGDKVRISIPSKYNGTMDIFSDAGKPVINYGKRLGQVTQVGDSVGGWGHFAYGHQTWGVHFSSYIFTTKRQSNGVVKFSILPVNSNRGGTPYILTETIVTRPDQIVTQIRGYDSVTDTLTLEVLT